MNGVVFVHSKIKDPLATSEEGEPQIKTGTIEDRTPGSTFYDSFNHSMLLYYTFWGVDDFQKVLEKEGGLRKPVIGSVSLGEKELITFGVHKEENYANTGRHGSSSNSKRLSMQAISKFESMSGKSYTLSILDPTGW